MPSADELPPPPGRLAPLADSDHRDPNVGDANNSDHGNSDQHPVAIPPAAVPARLENPPVPPTTGRPKKARSAGALSGISIFGKDFEQMIDNARDRIEEAIEDSADRENWK